MRELEKLTRQAALFAEGAEALGVEHLPLRLRGGAGPATDGERPRESEPTASARRPRRPLPDREALVALLEQYRGNVADVARHLDRHWGVVQRALAKHRIDAGDYRRDDE